MAVVTFPTLIFVVGGLVQRFSEVLCDLVLRMNPAVKVWLTEAAEGSGGAARFFLLRLHLSSRAAN